MKINIEKEKTYFDLILEFDISKVYSIELKIVNENGKEIASFTKNQLIYQKMEDDNLIIRIKCSSKKCIVIVKLFSDGILNRTNFFIVENNYNSELDKIKIVNRGPLVEQIDSFINRKRNNIYVVHNPKISWRNEAKNEISLFTSEGKLLFLKEYMAEIWNKIGKGKEYSDLKMNDNKNILDATLEIMFSKNLICGIDIK